jgi:hypothetical protein
MARSPEFTSAMATDQVDGQATWLQEQKPKIILPRSGLLELETRVDALA